MEKVYKLKDKTGKIYKCKFNHISIVIEFARISNLKFIN